MLRALVAMVAFAPALAHAQVKRCVGAEFTPTDRLQIVVWIETASGQYVDTLFITQQTGSFGLGNRPGRYDFNSGPNWPYGRRVDTFPIWAHRNGQSFPSVVFQNLTDSSAQPIQDPNYCSALGAADRFYPICGENDLSHPSTQSSAEVHYCQPLLPSSAAFDAMTCPSASFTDKGRFSTDPSFNTGYPPRTDLTTQQYDSPSVAMYKAMNPFDAVSQPTPVGGTVARAPWSVPDDLPDGDYVIYVETALESDFNATYNATSLPSPPNIQWSAYGVPTRGQPSILYSVPVTISSTAATTALTTDYAGYGDPDGATGTLHAPDVTISTDTPGSGGARLQLVSDGTNMYRLRVTVGPDDPSHVPTAPAELQSTQVTASDATLTFIAPGVGGAPVTGYDIRVQANTPITEATFADATPITARVVPVAPGALQTVDVPGLLPLTDYYIAVRAFDGCDNAGPIAVVHVTTADRQSGTVDACFVATAAYGSILANDVELLRHFRDTWLETNVIGELGVEAYYTFGPAFAGVVGESNLLRTGARDLLAPIVRVIRGMGR
jgi:hypothetical protein